MVNSTFYLLINRGKLRKFKSKAVKLRNNTGKLRNNSINIFDNSIDAQDTFSRREALRKEKEKKTISQARRHSSKFSIPNLNVSINIICCLNDIRFDNVLKKISSQLH